jgi:AraC-like DNA-binding protein
LYFLPDVIRASSLGEDAQYLTPFLLQDAKFPHIIPRRTGLPNEILNLILRIQTNLPPTTERARLVARTYLKMALVQLILHYEGQLGTTRVFSRRERDHVRLQPVFDYLDSHYPEPIAIVKTAALLGMSKSHFMRFFKKVTGQSFVKYLNHFRIAKALRLLASTDKPISEVSQDVGFCDQSYFGLIFHRILRMTPRGYRKSFVAPE